MRINIDGGYLEYDVIGSGIPLLFIHGYPLSLKIWEPQRNGLSDQAKVIRIDLRGHGDSFPFDGPYSMDLLADDCVNLIGEININTPIVACGLSMGGYVTMSMYRRYPDMIKGMILTATRSGADSPEAKLNRDSGINAAYEQGIGSIVENMLKKIVSPSTHISKPDLVNQIRSIMSQTSINGIVGALQGMKDRLDSTSILSQAKCPVLIIHGADDQLIPKSEAELMHKQTPNSKLVIIPDAGHLPNLEQPEKFNQAVRDFIQLLG